MYLHVFAHIYCMWQYTNQLDGYILYIVYRAAVSVAAGLVCALGDVYGVLHPSFMWNAIHFPFIHRIGSASACVLSVMMTRLYV